MSAFIAVKYEDRVELLTDGAVYNEDGTLTDIRRKVWNSDTIPLAITGRGDICQVENVARFIIGIADACGSFDLMIERLQAMLDRRHGIVQQHNSEFLIVGISERQGPIILHFATMQIDGYPAAWTLSDCGTDVLAGSDCVPPQELYKDKEFRDFAPAVMEWARQKKGINPTKPNLPAVHGIGGRMDHCRHCSADRD